MKKNVDPYDHFATCQLVPINVLVVVVVVVVLLLTAESHTNRSHVSNIFTCVVIYSQTFLSSARNMTFSYRRHNETKNS